MRTIALPAALASAAVVSLWACAGCVDARSPATQTPAVMPADLVLNGGVILTMNPAAPRAEGVAVRGDRIVAVGSSAEIGRFVGPATKVIDLHGRMATPGLVDAHCHLSELGAALDQLSLRGAASVDEIGKLVAEADRKVAPGEWITGRGWDQNLWKPAVFPDYAALDKAAPSRPVVLERIDGHALWVSSAVLRIAGITKDTPDPPGGRIVRDPGGQPTGVLVDNAAGLVEEKLPAPPPDVLKRRILRAAGVALSLGLTGVHEMGIDDATIAVYRSLADGGELQLRIYAYLAGAGHMDTLSARKPDKDPDGTRMFVVRGVKLFADGALGSRGASLLAPYDDEPKSSGLVLTPPDALARSAKIAAAAGFQLAVHAIGDAANRAVLDAFAAAGSTPARDLRFRVEHAQVVSQEDIPRFAALGVIASMQPTHATSDMPWAEARIGAMRIKGAYAWRSILSTGAHVAFGSDFPVEEPSPLLGLYAAVTRQDKNGKPDGGWRPEQRLTLDEALRAFTVEPAWAAFAESSRGTMTTGYVADITVFDRPLAADRSLVSATNVDYVIVGGKVAFERGK